MIPVVLNDEMSLPPDLDVIPAWATLLTSMFLHSGIYHLGGNMLFLWIFGDNVEDAMGHTRFLLLFAACGVLAGLTQAFVDPDSLAPVIGASGAIAGVLGAYLMLHPRRRMIVLVLRMIPIRLHVGLVLIFWGLFQVGSAFVLNGDPDNDTAWWAYIGGFIAGMVLVVVFKRWSVPLFDMDLVSEKKDKKERVSY